MSEKTTSSSSAGGIGFLGLLQVALIVLKLCHVISWSWWLILLPTIIGGSITIVALAAILAIAVFASK